jgi:hypothetical protein
VEAVALREPGSLRRLDLFGALDRCHENDAFATPFVNPARDNELEVHACYRQYIELLRKATGPIINRSCPYIRSAYTKFHNGSPGLMFAGLEKPLHRCSILANRNFVLPVDFLLHGGVLRVWCWTRLSQSRRLIDLTA